MRNIKFAYFLAGVFCLSSLMGCDREKRQVESNLERMKSEPISLCLDQMECRLNPLSGIENKTYRMVVYVDSAECSSCALSKLRFWNPLIKETREKKVDIDYIFILAPKKETMDDVNMELEITDLQSSIYLDTAYIFMKQNVVIPKEKKYHSFLLNKKGYTIFVGDPIKNKKIKNVYDKAFNNFSYYE